MRIRIVFGLAEAFELGFSMHFQDEALPPTGEIFELLLPKLPKPQKLPSGETGLKDMTILIDANGAEQDYVFEGWFRLGLVHASMLGAWSYMARMFEPMV